MLKKFTFAVGVLLLAPLTASHAEPTSLEQHIAREETWKSAGMFLLPHRPNYFMPLSYNANPNLAPFPPGTELGKFETKFQLSAKIPIAERFFKYNVATYMAYTQQSFWQAYNNQDSSLFRDTDYEPEFFLQFNDAHRLGSAVTNRYNRLGYDHQSNGLAGTQSRSWNRVYVEGVFDTAHTFFSIKPWYRIAGPKDRDSNPDMWKYMGYGELRGAVSYGSQEFSLMFRNNLQTHDNKGAIELGWMFPLIRSMKGYVQYFNGYGESLLDYNVPASRISAGVAFSSWL